MSVYTRKHDRLKRIERKISEKKAAQEQEIAEVTIKAVKRYKRRGVALTETSPEAQIAALDRYINDLRLIGAEMEMRYPDVSRRRFWMIYHEIDNCIEAVAR